MIRNSESIIILILKLELIDIYGNFIYTLRGHLLAALIQTIKNRKYPTIWYVKLP